MGQDRSVGAGDEGGWLLREEQVTRLLVEAGGADVWCKRPYDRKLPLDVAASENNKWVDRTRVVVSLRRKMGLEEVTTRCF